MRTLFTSLFLATAVLLGETNALADTQIVQQATAAGTAVSNTTTETSLARKTFAANELTPGKTFVVDGLARVTAQNSTDTLSTGVRFGTSSTPASNTACAASTAVDAAVGDVAVIRIVIDVQTTTRAVLTVYLNDADAEGQGVESYSEILTIAKGTVYYLDWTGTWSVASASNSVQAEAFTVSEST